MRDRGTEQLPQSHANWVIRFGLWEYHSDVVAGETWRKGVSDSRIFG